MEETWSCPKCKSKIIIITERLDGWTICPICGITLSVNFDYDLELDSEWHIISETCENGKPEDYFESKIYIE